MENPSQNTTFLASKWDFGGEGDPVLLYFEIDSERYELRRIEVFADGRMQKADDVNELKAETILSTELFPPLEEIAHHEEGETWEITKEEFEAVWQQAVYA